jgi:hypothetical protein
MVKSLCLIKHYAMKSCGKWMYRSTFSLPRYLVELSGQLHAPVALTPEDGTPGTHCIGRWVNPRTGLDDMEKRKFLPHRDSNSDSSVIQLIVSRYTGYAAPAAKARGNLII